MRTKRGKNDFKTVKYQSAHVNPSALHSRKKASHYQQKEGKLNETIENIIMVGNIRYRMLPSKQPANQCRLS